MAHKKMVFENYIGSVYNGMTIVSFIRQNESYDTFWNCRCFCGQMFEATLRGLKYGRTKSCGCKTKTGPKQEDLTGKVFNRLTVLSFSHKNKSYDTFWNCRCVCGNLTVAPRSRLNSGEKQSCGCYGNEVRQQESEKLKLDLTGGTSGFLSFVKDLPTRVTPAGNRVRMIQCVCRACNRPHTMDAGRFVSGEIRSCGCLQHQTKIQKGQERRANRTHKFCTKCQTNKHLSLFNTRIQNGYRSPSSYCKECVKISRLQPG
jgi:hypothetical protein